MRHALSQFLGYKFTKVELRQEVYFPRGHSEYEDDQLAIRRGMIAMLKGEVAFPVRIIGVVPVEQPQAAQPALLERKREG